MSCPESKLTARLFLKQPQDRPLHCENTGHQNVPIQKPLLIMVRILGHFGVRRTLQFLQCDYTV